ncbi:BA14K family protein [Terrihabitans rhizophilus]|jgi:hypothetical protein|uniref:Lectin-like protein BA14k n=1 Tax=Terrihabitans rhizophilus TaxID=3092662 RepID=A0ABU4RTA2_9HYPH|nr:BA14K family protein [Terrihabitans sp. PJ23]MDX6806865.1 BA14K family protein [Terrihabitans sp. PJ23]
MRKFITWCVAAAMAAGTFVAPASAQIAGTRAPVAAATADVSNNVETVQYNRRWREGRSYRGGRHYRGGRGYYRNRGYSSRRYYGNRRYYGGRRYYNNRRYYGYRRGNDGVAIAAGVLGLAAGAAIASSANAGSSHAYCESRFRSYDRRSRTYLGYDGRRHSCP